MREQPIVGDDEAVEQLPFFVPRPNPSPIPTQQIFDEPLVCLEINQFWASHFRGVIDALDQPDTWIGTEEEIEAARQQIREALAKFGQECMVCCDEELVLLEQIRVLNQTLVTNQVTIINQNNTTTVSQYQNEYNNFVTNNNNTKNYNQQLFDGEPQSIYPDAGANFNSTGDERLCSAIDTYINAQIYTHGQESNNLQYAATAAATTFLAIGALLSVISGGASIAIGLAVNTAIFVGLETWEAILNDQQAQRKVKCCMYDALIDQPLTIENFQTSTDSCGFDSGSNEQRLAQQISHDNAFYEENWLAFLRAMSQASTDSVGACSCDCEDDIILESNNGSTITAMGNCIYRFVGVSEGVYDYIEFNDALNRCLHVENSDDVEFPTGGVGHDTNVTDCDGVLGAPFVGGFTPGDLRSVRYMGSYNHFKVTLA